MMKFHIEKQDKIMTQIGHNNPPDPIDEALAPHADTIDEAQMWLDGEPIETDGALKASDLILKGLKAALKDVNASAKSATAPLHDAWKAEIARWKPTQADLELMVKGIVAAQDPFKRKLAEQKEAEKRAAWMEAEKARIAAERAAIAANDADIEAKREAAEKADLAQKAKEKASIKQKETVKGMRTVHKHTIWDHRAALHWIAQNDRDAVTAFIETYVAKNHKTHEIGGVTSWQEKEAY